MPRRSRRGPSVSRKHHNTSAPPPPINIVKPVLDIAGLAQAYEWFAVDRIIAFKLAFEWYAKSVPTLLFGDALDEARQKSYDRAIKSKNIGDSTSSMPEEKDHSYTTAIHLFEKVWKDRGLPAVDDAMKATTPSKRVENVQTVLSTLNTAFNGNVKFRMTFNPDREFLHGEILLPKAEIDRMIPMTPLQNALNEVPTVAKVMSIVEVDGNQELDGGKFMNTLPALLADIGAWSTGNRETLKAIGKAPITPHSAAGTRTLKTPGSAATPRQPSNNIRITDRMTITLVDESKVPAMGGKRLQALVTTMRSATIAAAKAALEAASLKGYIGFAVNTLVAAGAISVQ